MTKEACWCCGADDIAYVDILDLPWCEECYVEEFLG